MNKKIGALITALCMTGSMAAYAELDSQAIEDFVNGQTEVDFGGADEDDLGVGGQGKPNPGVLPDYVTTNNAEPVGVRGVCEYKWPARKHPPLPVTVYFADDDDDDSNDPWEMAMWENVGGVSGAGVPGGNQSALLLESPTQGWSLIADEGPIANDSWRMKWLFAINDGRRVTKIVINGFDGFGPEVDSHKWDDEYEELLATVFDIRKGGGTEITEGSQNGYPFTYTANAEMVGLEAIYSHPIYIEDNGEDSIDPNMHDLYGTLTINFGTPFFGTVDLGNMLLFRADTDCVLEVDLDSFSAEVRGNQVRVEWKTLSERETDGFRVTRNEETVCDMPSMGDDRDGDTYVCRDPNGSAGDSYDLWEVQTTDGNMVLLDSQTAQ